MEAEAPAEDQHSEFHLQPFAQVCDEYLQLTHSRQEEKHAEEHDLPTEQLLSKRRRETPASFAYNPSLDAVLHEKHCYLCLTKTHKEYPRFYGILAEHLGYTEFDTIIEMMYKFFDHFIHPFTVLPVQVTRAKIKLHVLHHMNEPLVEYHTQLHHYKTARDLLMDSFVQTNGQGDNLFDYKAMSTVEKLNARIIALYKEKPREALFVNPALNIG